MKIFDAIKYLFFEGDDEHTSIWCVGVILFVILQISMDIIPYNRVLWTKCFDAATIMIVMLHLTLAVRIVKNLIDIDENWLDDETETEGS